MTSQNSRQDLYEPKTLAAMDQAFAAIWKVLRADDPFRDYARDGELRLVIGQKLLNLAADGVTDPVRLRKLTVESLLFPHHWEAIALPCRAPKGRRMMTPVESFIHRENIKNFERRLADRTTDEEQRKMLARLLADERAKAQSQNG